MSRGGDSSATENHRDAGEEPGASSAQVAPGSRSPREPAGGQGGRKRAAAPPPKKGISIGPLEVILGIAAAIFGYLIMQKQSADALVAQCAQQHERGEYEQALSLCTDALLAYHSVNEYTKVAGLFDGLLWADVAQTTDNLGVVTMNLGDTASSLQYLEAALAMRTAKLGPEALDVAATKDNIGLVYRQMNDVEKAKAFHHEVG